MQNDLKEEALAKVVILVNTGIQVFDKSCEPLDSRLRGNDGYWALKTFARGSEGFFFDLNL